MKNVIEWIQRQDPEYDPIAFACHSLGISRVAVQTIYNYIYADGYFGATSSHLSICVKCGDLSPECDCPAQFKVDGLQEGIEILAAVQMEIGDYYDEVVVEYIDECPRFEPELVAEAGDIARAAFSTFIEIYGTTPAGVAQPRF